MLRPIKCDSRAYTSAGPIVERKDCSVRALSVAACMPYEQAHAILAAHGRKAGHGTSVRTSRDAHAALGFPYVQTWQFNARMQQSFPSLARFVNEHPAGHWIIHTRNHALAVVDGVVHDWHFGTGPRARIVRAWKVL